MRMPPKILKHVHFAEQNVFYSPPPVNNLPPNLSVTTPPSSAETNYNFSSLKIPRRIWLHRYLAVSAVTWNLVDRPTAITRNYFPISTRTIYEPATHPPQRFITVISPHLPWTINVHASNGSYITVEDVLHAIYYSLRTNISKAEFHLLATQDERWRAASAYRLRYRRHRSTRVYEQEKQSGMKRIDFLMGHTRFLGISKTGNDPNTWKLNVTGWN